MFTLQFNTIRTARSLTSAEYRFDVPMTPILSKYGASGKAGGVQSDRITFLGHALLSPYLFYRLRQHGEPEVAKILIVGKRAFNLAPHLSSDFFEFVHVFPYPWSTLHRSVPSFDRAPQHSLTEIALSLAC